MAKNKKEKIANSNKVANIIVGIVGGIAALIIIAVIVLVSVRVDPMDKINNPDRYDFYKIGGTTPESTNDAAQSNIRTAMGEMDFSVMSAVLRWRWDYSFNFEYDSDGKKVEMTADEVDAIKATDTEYMIEYVYAPAKITNGEVDYSTCQSLVVDGETVYFDRLKVRIGNSNGNVGLITLYPYIYDRVANRVADGGATRASYRVTKITIRANTSSAFIALGEVADSVK